jgi:hypothetical protein
MELAQKSWLVVLFRVQPQDGVDPAEVIICTMILLRRVFADPVFMRRAFSHRVIIEAIVHASSMSNIAIFRSEQDQIQTLYRDGL